MGSYLFRIRHLEQELVLATSKYKNSNAKLKNLEAENRRLEESNSFHLNETSRLKKDLFKTEDELSVDREIVEHLKELNSAIEGVSVRLN